MISTCSLLVLLAAAATCQGNSIQGVEAKKHCKLNDGKLLCKNYESEQLDMSRVLDYVSLEDQVVHVEMKNGRTPTIGRGAFRNVKSVTQLIIRNMAVSTIDMDAFEGLSGIKLLDLSHNNITFFHASTFKTINLRNLRLDGNPFLEVPTNSPLLNAPKLQWLSLRHCGIQHLPAVAFQGTPHLAHLDLSSNRLSILPQVLFANTSLTSLDLSYNDLRSISLGMFHAVPGYPRLPRTVLLAGNPWHCDCDLAQAVMWLSQDVDTHYPTTDPARSRLQVRTTCASPSNVAALSWHQYDEWECAF